MKQITVILILLLPCISFAQLNTGIAAGYDTHGRAIANWYVGATISKIIEVTGEIRPSLTRSVFAHNYIGSKIGLNLTSPDHAGLRIIPAIGYYYDLKSQDKTNLNKYYWAASLKTVMQINDSGNGLFLEGLYIGKSAQITVGINVTL